MRYAVRPGGYTRIHRLAHRKGDHAEAAVLELVDGPRDLKRELLSRSIGKELAEQGGAGIEWHPSSSSSSSSSLSKTQQALKAMGANLITQEQGEKILRSLEQALSPRSLKALQKTIRYLPFESDAPSTSGVKAETIVTFSDSGEVSETSINSLHSDGEPSQESSVPYDGPFPDHTTRRTVSTYSTRGKRPPPPVLPYPDVSTLLSQIHYHYLRASVLVQPLSDLPSNLKNRLKTLGPRRPDEDKRLPPYPESARKASKIAADWERKSSNRDTLSIGPRKGRVTWGRDGRWLGESSPAENDVVVEAGKKTRADVGPLTVAKGGMGNWSRVGRRKGLRAIVHDRQDRLEADAAL
jgi:hypothetical protein